MVLTCWQHLFIYSKHFFVSSKHNEMHRKWNHEHGFKIDKTIFREHSMEKKKRVHSNEILTPYQRDKPFHARSGKTETQVKDGVSMTLWCWTTQDIIQTTMRSMAMMKRKIRQKMRLVTQVALLLDYARSPLWTLEPVTASTITLMIIVPKKRGVGGFSIYDTDVKLNMIGWHTTYLFYSSLCLNS